MYRLLIADDEESIREGVADFVRQNCPEWDVAALARDGREALALAREILPDAVLTDITMPHMNGLEFLESLSDLLPEAKLLVLSGYDQFEYAVQALRLGVSDYLLKPLDTAKLVSFEPFRSGTGRTGFALGPDRNAADQHAENQRAGIAELFPCCVAGRRAACSLCGKRRVCARGDKLLLRTVRRPGRTARSFRAGAGTTALWRGAYCTAPSRHAAPAGGGVLCASHGTRRAVSHAEPCAYFHCGIL